MFNLSDVTVGWLVLRQTLPPNSGSDRLSPAKQSVNLFRSGIGGIAIEAGGDKGRQNR